MPRRQLEATQSQLIPHVSADYCIFGQIEEASLPVTALRDHASMTEFWHAIPHKGVERGLYPAEQVAYSIPQRGRKKPIFKGSQEPSLVAIKCGVMEILFQIMALKLSYQRNPPWRHICPLG